MTPSPARLDAIFKNLAGSRHVLRYAAAHDIRLGAMRDRLRQFLRGLPAPGRELQTYLEVLDGLLEEADERIDVNDLRRPSGRLPPRDVRVACCCMYIARVCRALSATPSAAGPH